MPKKKKDKFEASNSKSETISNYPNANVKTRREMVAFMLRCLGHLNIGYLNLGIPAGMVRTNFDIRI